MSSVPTVVISLDNPWQIWIDVGGTFTDCVARSPDGSIHSAKVLNRNQADAPVLAIRQIMGIANDAPVGPIDLRLGTTRGTNALLERNGARVGLVTTRGFADLPLIGTQARPDLFALDIRKPPPLHTAAVEIDERIDTHGKVVTTIDTIVVERDLKRLRDDGIDTLAIALVNAFANDTHERVVEKIARRLGFTHVSVSTALSPTIHLLNRMDTALVDAYLSPVIRDYVQRLREQLPAARIRMLTSAGALVDAQHFAGKDSILSGPAGGVVGFARAATVAGCDAAIGFDMGGTSTDVSRFAGDYEYEYAGQKAGVRIVSPMYAIETVAAGGGSICAFDGTRLTIGPASAGADPGPACYGRGGPLTVTDVNVMTGKIDANRFAFALDRAAVDQRFAEIADAIETATDQRMSPQEIAAGLTRVANLKMASAIQRVSAARGYDPADHTLVSFGGAGAQHACAIAGSLGIDRVLLHPLAGVLSAWGMGMADVTRFAEKSVLDEFSKPLLDRLRREFDRIADDLRGQVITEGIAPERIGAARWLLDLRYRGTDAPITVAQPDDDDWKSAFKRMHQQLYGHTHPQRPIEVATLRVEVCGRTEKADAPVEAKVSRTVEPGERRAVWFDGEQHDTAVYRREQLCPGDTITGPAIVTEDYSTIVVDPGWEVEVTERGDLVATRAMEDRGIAKPQAAGTGGSGEDGAAYDPIRLELFNNHFSHIALQMGVTLQRTAISVNVKERLDFSCALLDAAGHLVVNAPHIPVHLGAMGASVRGLLHNIDDIRPGDVYLSNDPDLGGSHLPDLTVMTPVFDETGAELRFFAASRAHHAEIGGLRPGSAFPFAKCLAEEGVVLRNLRIARDGVLDEKGLRAALTGGPYPSRNPDENVADLRAAIAANQVGVREIEQLIQRFSWPTVEAYMGHIRDAAERLTRKCITQLPDGRHAFTDALDDGSPIAVAVTVTGDAMAVDFTGTGPVNANSLNANGAIVGSAIIYAMRGLIGRDIPLNAGLMAPIEIVLPQCMLNPPREPDATKHAAVVGGNVELSQRIVDVFFGALGIVAASQGTMNNVVFGSDTFGYYETIGGGAGAGPTFDGADAVHTHMTNTRITDAEIIERRYPVMLEGFLVRHGSGGLGAQRGGDGIVRSLRFMEPVSVSLLTQRRATGAFGLAGGGAGAPGKNSLRRVGGVVEALGGLAEFEARAGDVLTIETPGGGGYGKP